MLYERWLKIAGETPSAIAFRDLPSGRVWTFGQLQDAAEQTHLEPGDLVFPQGLGADFILVTLAGWRSRRPVCPLEVGQERPACLEKVIPDSVCHLKTTSASTGASRLVAFKPEQLAADAENIVGTMGLHPDLPNLGVISLAHSYGFSNLVLPLLLHGIPLVLVGSGLPEALRQAANGYRDLTLAAVPALWRTWHEADAIPANVRLAISAGAALPLPLERDVFEKRSLKIHNFYGSSECGGIAYDDSPMPRTSPELAGKPLLNVRLSVATDGCLEVPREGGRRELLAGAIADAAAGYV